MNTYIILGIIVSIYGLWILYSSYKKSKEEQKRTIDINYCVKSEKCKDIFNKIANRIAKHTILCDVYSSFSIIIGYAIIPIMSYLLLSDITKMSTNENIMMELTPLIPEVTIHITIGLLIAIIIGIVIHEMAHGIIAVRNGISIEDVGILYFLIPLGAYVNPNEDEYENARSLSKLKIVAAGPFANLIAALLFFIVLSIVYFTFDSMIISAVSIQSPLHGIIHPGTIIHSVNGIEITSANMLTIFNQAPNFLMTIATSEGIYTAQRGTMELMGLIITPKFNLFGDIVFWGFLINFSLGIVNLVPLFILDGGHMITIPFEKFNYVKNTLPVIFGGLITSAFISLLIFSLSGSRVISLFLFKIGISLIIAIILWNLFFEKVRDKIRDRRDELGKIKMKLIQVAFFGIFYPIMCIVLYGLFPELSLPIVYENFSIVSIILLSFVFICIEIICTVNLDEDESTDEEVIEDK